MNTAINAKHCEQTNETIKPSFELLVKLGFKIVEKMATRVVALTKDDWSHLERLFILLKDANDTDKAEIVEAIAETLFPEELIGGVATFDESQHKDARARLESYRKQVGEQVRVRREELGLTQAELAHRSKLPQSHVSRIECGKHTPTHITITRLAKALKTKASQLDPGFCDDDKE